MMTQSLTMTRLLRPVRIGSALLAALLVLAGCSVAPTYERPSVDTPAAFKEAAPATQTGANGSQWKTAQPAEDIARGQ